MMGNDSSRTSRAMQSECADRTRRSPVAPARKRLACLDSRLRGNDECGLSLEIAKFDSSKPSLCISRSRRRSASIPAFASARRLNLNCLGKLVRRHIRHSRVGGNPDKPMAWSALEAQKAPTRRQYRLQKRGPQCKLAWTHDVALTRIAAACCPRSAPCWSSGDEALTSTRRCRSAFGMFWIGANHRVTERAAL